MFLLYRQQPFTSLRRYSPHHPILTRRCWWLLSCHTAWLPLLPLNPQQYEPRLLSSSVPVNLFSLGHLQRCGATYGPDPIRPLTHITVRIFPGGPIIAHASLTPNNLLLVNFISLQSAATLSPQHYQPPLALSSAFPIPHINVEQRMRADAAEQLHIDLCHPSDSCLCSDLSIWKLPFSSLTAADVTLNRTLRGPCPHCTAGKHRNPPHPTSTSPPASSIGQVKALNVT